MNNWLIICGARDFEDGRPLYWKNDQGWVDREHAQVFTDDERSQGDWFLPVDGWWTHEFDFEVHDTDSGVVYTPWTNGWSLGYKCTWPDGHVEVFYLNPSGGSDLPDDPTIFVYQGTGDLNEDPPLHHYDIERSEPADDRPIYGPPVPLTPEEQASWDRVRLRHTVDPLGAPNLAELLAESRARAADPEEDA